MTSIDSDETWGPPDWAATPPDHPIVDDDSAAILDQAIVELTLQRTPMAVGDGLADLHALASLLAQLHAWLPVAVAAARRHQHTWNNIAAQLEISPATARRRHNLYTRTPPPSPSDTPTPHLSVEP